MRWLAGLLACVASAAAAADPLPRQEAVAWLQKMSDASRHQAYEGVFVYQHGDLMQTLHVANRPVGPAKESQLKAMDGQPREVRCGRSGSVTVIQEGGALKAERRVGNRHFPDLLPADATKLANWYVLRLGAMDRVAGMDCQQVILAPRDAYRWGHTLCAEKATALPLRAVMLNAQGQPLFQYAFTELRIGSAARVDELSKAMPGAPEAMPPGSDEQIVVRQLPPGFSRVAAMRRTFPNKAHGVEHWVFSDGLTHISLFIEPADHPVEAMKGQSAKGMLNMLTRQVGRWQVTVLGDAPWPAVESIAMNLAERRP